jgi:hypothetical protein
MFARTVQVAPKLQFDCQRFRISQSAYVCSHFHYDLRDGTASTWMGDKSSLGQFANAQQKPDRAPNARERRVGVMMTPLAADNFRMNTSMVDMAPLIIWLF